MKQNGYLILLICTLVCMACGEPNNALVIREQGSFFVGGTVKTEQGVYDTHHALEPNGQTLHGDHAYVSYQIPTNAREYPLVFLHGSGQSAKTWETTPDGREDFPISSCAEVLAFISSTNLVVAVQDVVWNQDK